MVTQNIITNSGPIIYYLITRNKVTFFFPVMNSPALLFMTAAK
jgi:hypothetical protein